MTWVCVENRQRVESGVSTTASACRWLSSLCVSINFFCGFISRIETVEVLLRTLPTKKLFYFEAASPGGRLLQSHSQVTRQTLFFVFAAKRWLAGKQISKASKPVKAYDALKCLNYDWDRDSKFTVRFSLNCSYYFKKRKKSFGIIRWNK